jgi:tetratricopeptide (TPR) repeat protein
VHGWTTDRIFTQLRDIGIDTDAERFALQAADAGAFKVLEERWVKQIPESMKQPGMFWLDFPLVGIPVLWQRLASEVLCADLIEHRLYTVMRADEKGQSLPKVNGLPAELAAALELTQFLKRFDGLQRAAQFDLIDEEAGYYDYTDWLIEVLDEHTRKFPATVFEIADVLSECREPARFETIAAMALAHAGRKDDAAVRAQNTVQRFPDDLWAHLLAGDVFEELEDEDQAIRLWTAALALAKDAVDWDAAADRLSDLFDYSGREDDVEQILKQYPRPPGALRSPEPFDACDEHEGSELDPWMDSTIGKIAPPEHLTRARTVGRNEPCPCGSGKKYKKCCMK